MRELVDVHPDLVWDYPQAPDDPRWRLQRAAEGFPAYGRDRRTVHMLYERRHELDIPPERVLLIELYEEAWCEREGGRQ